MIFFMVWPGFAAAERGECVDQLTTVTLSPDSPKGELGQFLIALGRNLERELGVAVRQSHQITVGTIHGVINSGRLIALEYHVDAATEAAVLTDLVAMYAELQRLRTLNDLGARFWFRSFGSAEKSVVLLSLNPTTSDAFVAAWATSVREQKLKFVIHSHLTEHVAFLDKDLVYLAPRVLRFAGALEEAVHHESIHARDLNDPTKSISFRPAAHQYPAGLPNAPVGYERRMVSGEVEAQLGGKLRAGVDPKVAWARARPFLNQMDWLRTLRRDLGRPGYQFFPGAVQSVTVEGIDVEIVFDLPATATRAAQVREFVTRMVHQRLGQLEHLSRSQGQLVERE